MLIGKKLEAAVLILGRQSMSGHAESRRGERPKDEERNDRILRARQTPLPDVCAAQRSGVLKQQWGASVGCASACVRAGPRLSRAAHHGR